MSETRNKCVITGALYLTFFASVSRSNATVTLGTFEPKLCNCLLTNANCVSVVYHNRIVILHSVATFDF